MVRRRRRHLDDDVPRLPRGRGLALSRGAMLRIAMVVVALVALLVLQKPCADSMSRFVTGFGVDAGVTVTAPDGGVDGGGGLPPGMTGVQLRGDMTPEEIEAAVRKAREEAGMVGADAGAAAEAGTGTGTGSGSGPR